MNQRCERAIDGHCRIKGNNPIHCACRRSTSLWGGWHCHPTHPKIRSRCNEAGPRIIVAENWPFTSLKGSTYSGLYRLCGGG
jgi:hypothetical protein